MVIAFDADGIDHADIEFVVVVNQKWWDALSAETRGHIEAAADVAEETVRDAVAQSETDAYTAAKENGMTVYTPTAEEIEAWKAASTSVYDKYTEGAGELGKKIMDAAKAL